MEKTMVEDCDPSLDEMFPEGSLYEDMITKRIWMLQTRVTGFSGMVILTPYETTQTGEVLEVPAATFIASKRFKRVPSEALVITPEGAFIQMDEELLSLTFGPMEDYPSQEEMKSLGNVVNFTRPAANVPTQAAVSIPSMEYHPLTKVTEMKERLMEIASCHRKILVETEALLATLTAFERDFKSQLDISVSDI